MLQIHNSWWYWLIVLVSRGCFNKHDWLSRTVRPGDGPSSHGTCPWVEWSVAESDGPVLLTETAPRFVCFQIMQSLKTYESGHTHKQPGPWHVLVLGVDDLELNWSDGNRMGTVGVSNRENPGGVRTMVSCVKRVDFDLQPSTFPFRVIMLTDGYWLYSTLLN